MINRIPPFQNAKNKCDIIYWGYFMLERIPPLQMQSTMQHYLLGYMYAHENTSLSKCIVQMRHYLMELFFALENTHLSHFRNAKYKCDIICWNYSLFQRIPTFPLFEMQSTNVTLFAGVFCALENILHSKYKIQIRHYLLELFFVLENTHLSPFRNAKCKCDIICWGILCFREYSPFQI